MGKKKHALLGQLKYGDLVFKLVLLPENSCAGWLVRPLSGPSATTRPNLIAKLEMHKVVCKIIIRIMVM